MEKACFYGVSVGSGDPQLLTFRAAGVIAACPVIAAPLCSLRRKERI